MAFIRITDNRRSHIINLDEVIDMLINYTHTYIRINLKGREKVLLNYGSYEEALKVFDQIEEVINQKTM